MADVKMTVGEPTIESTFSVGTPHVDLTFSIGPVTVAKKIPLADLLGVVGPDKALLQKFAPDLLKKGSAALEFDKVSRVPVVTLSDPDGYALFAARNRARASASARTTRPDVPEFIPLSEAQQLLNGAPPETVYPGIGSKLGHEPYMKLGVDQRTGQPVPFIRHPQHPNTIVAAARGRQLAVEQDKEKLLDMAVDAGMEPQETAPMTGKQMHEHAPLKPDAETDRGMGPIGEVT